MKLMDIRVRGGQHHQYDEAIRRGLLTLGCQLHLVRDPENMYDSNAIQAYVRDGQDWVMVGYVSAKDASRFALRMDKGAVVHLCTVTKLSGKGCDASLDLRGGWGPRESSIPDNAGPAPESIPDDDIPF